MSGHTPGPWHAETDNGLKPSIAARGLTVAEVWSRSELGPERCPIARANTHLIAAAPAMLEALERIQEHLRDGRSLFTTFDIAGAAIAKAKGETE